MSEKISLSMLYDMNVSMFSGDDRIGLKILYHNLIVCNKHVNMYYLHCFKKFNLVIYAFFQTFEYPLNSIATTLIVGLFFASKFKHIFASLAHRNELFFLALSAWRQELIRYFLLPSTTKILLLLS